MAVNINHKFVSAKPDGSDPTEVQASNWNETHDITAAAETLLGNSAGTQGAIEELALGTGLNFTAGTLNATGITTTLTRVNQTLSYVDEEGTVNSIDLAPIQGVTTTLELIGNTLRYTDEESAQTNIDMSPFANQSRIVSGDYDPSTTNLTLTRADTSAILIDFSDIITNYTPEYAGNPYEVIQIDGTGEPQWVTSVSLKRDVIGTAPDENIDIANGSIQDLALTVDTTITFTMQDGDHLMLHITGAQGLILTWQNTTWIGKTAPVMTNNDMLSFFQKGGIIYGSYLGDL